MILVSSPSSSCVVIVCVAIVYGVYVVRPYDYLLPSEREELQLAIGGYTLFSALISIVVGGFAQNNVGSS